MNENFGGQNNNQNKNDEKSYSQYNQQQYDGNPNKNLPNEYNWDFKQYENIKSEEQTKKNKKKSKGLIVFSCILGACIVIGSIVVGTFAISQVFFDRTKTATQEESQTSPSLYLNDKPAENVDFVSPDGKLTTEQIYSKVSPSVVGIVSYRQSGNLFSAKMGEGSGIVMRADGYIITNAHVIDGADGFKVVLSNGEEYAGVVVGKDLDTDLAVIKIEAHDLTFAEFGNSQQVNIGEKVVAIGNPSGLQLAGTTTQGIISSKDRPVTTENGITVNCLQTDAAINPGNSGGALVNEYGQVIGITSSKISSVDYEGIGFAIPISDAQPIINDIIDYGYVKGRVKIGVTLEPIDEILASMNNVPTGL
ncbi:MAG: trypsin-like peptidase domain-containing protein, partial [Oscillospiraceae bacterium]